MVYVYVRVGLWEQLGRRSSLYENCPLTAKWRRSRYGSIWPSVGRPAQSPQEFDDSSAGGICRTPAPRASSRRHRLPMTIPTYKRGSATRSSLRWCGAFRPLDEGLKLRSAAGHSPALVRLRRREDGAVEVRSCAVKSRAVSNRNCVAVRRGGEHRNENDQSVTQACRVASRRELDSVGVDGRAFE